MTTYVIGDVQGCFAELQALLAHVAFDEKKDTLWFVGDLVNRGPDSLAVLRFVKALGKRQITVLGNHDLHLLAVAHGYRELQRGDTLQPILETSDREELLDWLRTRPLLHYETQYRCVLVHAGIPPVWDMETARRCAREVETVLGSADYHGLLASAFADQPDTWRVDLQGLDRHRFILNGLTRMRFCDDAGRLDFEHNGAIGSQPPNLKPWFEAACRCPLEETVIFGHWAALGGRVSVPNLFALDTGCFWGNELTALRLPDYRRFSVKKL